MKKTQLFISFAILLTLFTACRNPLLSDPRIYNDDDEKVDITPIVPDEPSFDIEEETPGVVNPFDIKDAWFNNASCNGDETTAKEPISSFEAKEFDTMGMHSVFDNDNVPHYTFPKKADWSTADKVIPKYSLKGDNTTGKGFPIKNVTYYQYRGYNPLYSKKTNNQLQTTKTGSPLLSRFYFYQFIGDSAAGTLNNFLIAIDSYSKFVFAFAKPTAYKTVVGNKVPTEWGMVDGSTPFYEYDPVGYVTKNAKNEYEVIMYDWFQTNLANGNYDGSINKDFTKVAQKNPDGAGKSPFAREKAKGFGNNVMGNTYSYRDENGCGLNKIEYTFSDDGKSVTITTTPWNGTSYDETVAINESQDGDLKATATVNGVDIKLVLNEDNSLSINNQKALINFKDLGPGFLNRVKGKTFIGSGYKYIFSEDGKTITSGNDTYSFIEQKAHTHGKYKKGNYDYGITISTNDAIIKWSGGFGGDANKEGTNYPAYLKSDDYKGALLTFDTLIFYDRPADNINSYKNGETLYKYTFSDFGKTLTKTSENYTTKESSTIETYIFAEEIADSQNRGYFKDSKGNLIELDLSQDRKTIKLGDNQYSDTDPGPDFLIRVKGNPVFTGGARYEFLNSGYQLKVDETIYDYQYEGDNHNRAVYKTRNWQALKFYGVQLENNDTTIKMTSKSAEGGIGWLLGWEATRQ